MAQSKPVHETRLGRVRIAIWENRTERNDVWFNVTLSRLYKDEEGNWKDSSNFRRDDLPTIRQAADMAYSWLWTEGTQSGDRGKLK